MLPLTKEKLRSHQDRKVCYICGKRISQKLPKNKNCQKVRDRCHYTAKYRGAEHGICKLKFNVPNEIPVFSQNDSSYDYHFSRKELKSEFERKFECLGENTKKYKTFCVVIDKEVTKFDKDGNESVVTRSYKVKFFDSVRFFATSFSNLLDNLTEEIHKIKYQDCDCFLEYLSVKDNLIKYKRLYCNEDYWIKIDEKLKKRF